jgi:hypothetical protein
MWRPLIPLLTRTLPGAILGFCAKMCPWPTLHELIGFHITVDSGSRRIWDEKKRLFYLGDKSVVNEHGEGKDIMSILRTCSTRP